MVKIRYTPRRAKRAKTRPSHQIPPVLFVTACAAAALLLFTLTRGDEPTRPEKVQQKIPAWVTQQLLTPNEYSRPETPVAQVNAVVIHYVGNPATSAAANRSYFENLATTHETYASSNFIVGLEGEILQCVPVNEVAYCSSDRNFDTVSIEVCHPDAEGKFNDATMDSLVKLTAWLCWQFGLTADEVIRHYDVTGKECPIYYVHNEAAWAALKEAVTGQIEEFKAEA